jgi:hypothetical protein
VVLSAMSKCSGIWVLAPCVQATTATEMTKHGHMGQRNLHKAIRNGERISSASRPVTPYVVVLGADDGAA